MNTSATDRVIICDALTAEQVGQVMLRTLTGARREDTSLDCADSFQRDAQAVGTLTRLPQTEQSTQVLVDTR